MRKKQCSISFSLCKLKLKKKSAILVRTSQFSIKAALPQRSQNTQQVFVTPQCKNKDFKPTKIMKPKKNIAHLHYTHKKIYILYLLLIYYLLLILLNQKTLEFNTRSINQIRVIAFINIRKHRIIQIQTKNFFGHKVPLDLT